MAHRSFHRGHAETRIAAQYPYLAPRKRNSDRTRISSNPTFLQTYIMLFVANLSLDPVKLESGSPTIILFAGKDTCMQAIVCKTRVDRLDLLASIRASRCQGMLSCSDKSGSRFTGAHQ